MGEAGIVLVSPEQFRNRSFAEALRLRQIIREHFPGVAATVACFTATTTTRQEVISDLTQHFRDELGIELRCFRGGHERTNLSYRLIIATPTEKGQRLVELLTRGR